MTTRSPDQSESKYRVLLFTAQDIGFELVELLGLRDDIALKVVTHRTERDAAYGYRDAVDACRKHGIPFDSASRIGPALFNDLRSFAPDLLISAYFPHVIPDDVLKLSRRPAINIHPGILPLYRGKFPTPWYILNGETQYGMAIHQLDAGIDTGDVLTQKLYPIPANITGHALYRDTMKAGSRLIAESLDDLLSGRLTPVAQAGPGTYYNRIEPRWQIDWNLPREAISRRVRVHARPYFPAFTFALNHMISINAVSFDDPPGFQAQGGGIVFETGDDGSFVVTCSDGCLRVTDFEILPSASAASLLKSRQRLELP